MPRSTKSRPSLASGTATGIERVAAAAAALRLRGLRVRMAQLGLADFEVGTWSALIAPKGVPLAIVQKINAAVNATLNDPVVRQRLLDEGSEILVMTPAETAAFMRAENARWVKVVRDAGITPQ